MNNTDATTPADRQRKLADLLEGEAVDGAFARELREEYPFFTLADALLTRRAAEAGLPMPEGEERKKLLARIAINASDPAAAARLVNGESGSVETFYPPMPEKETPSTERAIDDFLNSYGSRTEEEDALLERLIFNPVGDYALTLDDDDAASDAASSIPAFPPLPPTPPATEPKEEPSAQAVSEPEPPAIAAEEPAPPTTPAPDPAAAPHPETPERRPREGAGNQALLSESLAKIFIKTRRYDKAYEILERLSLEFPEKSRYFADQLRFLRKLIIIEEHRKKQQS